MLFKFIKEVWAKDKKEILLFLVAPTYFWAFYSKWKSKDDKDLVRATLLKLNWRYFVLTIVAALVLGILSWVTVSASVLWLIVAGLVAYYAFSRINEIFVAFVRDARSHLKPTAHGSSLKYSERLPLAMRSYLELIVAYGVVYFALAHATDAFTQHLTIWKAIYYSGVTITTLGYGDISPKHPLTQFLAIYEVINGFSLIVVSFTVYVSRSITAQEYKGEGK